MQQTAYLPSKPRYEILDGLRGVAAIIVVLFHLTETYFEGQPVIQPLNHGYLAVDFFYVLSGFVVGYAYDDRWNKMTTGQFFKRRLVRLHPMLMFGMLFGALMFYFQGDFPGGSRSLIHLSGCLSWCACGASRSFLFPVRSTSVGGPRCTR